MAKFIRADQMPLPDTRTLGKRVHGFMDANPQLGQNPGGGLPSRGANRLFQQLMQYYNAPYSQIDDANDVLKQMGVQIDTDTYDDPDMALLDSPLGEFMGEGFGNELRKESANRAYDENQPYGFDFRRLIGDDHDFMVQPDGSVMSEYGEYISTPNENFIDGAKNTLMPIAKTAGSMALPMLFSMLMRGGK